MLVKTMDEQHIADIGHAFGYYDYGEERGMNVWFRSQEAVATYIRGYVRCVLTDGFVHTTSDRSEGGICGAVYGTVSFGIYRLPQFLWLLVGGVLCGVFGGLLFREYHPVKG